MIDDPKAIGPSDFDFETDRTGICQNLNVHFVAKVREVLKYERRNCTITVQRLPYLWCTYIPHMPLFASLLLPISLRAINIELNCQDELQIWQLQLNTFPRIRAYAYTIARIMRLKRCEIRNIR